MTKAKLSRQFNIQGKTLADLKKEFKNNAVVLEKLQAVFDVFDNPEKDEKEVVTSSVGWASGGVNKDGSKWYQVCINLGTINGKRLKKYVYGSTLKEANTKAIKVIAQKEAEKKKAAANISRAITLSQYLADWLEEYKHTVSISTGSFYKRKLQYVLNPKPGIHQIGHIKVNELTSDNIKELYTSMTSLGYKPKTIYHLNSTLRLALKGAYKKGLLPYHLWDMDDNLKAPYQETNERPVLNWNQSVLMLGAAKGSPIGAFIQLAFYTGMRKGELKGLTWNDINLETGDITVMRSISYVANEGNLVSPTKTNSSRRRIPLTKGHEVMATLAGLKAKQKDEQQALADAEAAAIGEKATPANIDSNLIFSHQINPNEPWSDKYIDRYFGRILKTAKLPHMGIHSLRHTHATLALAMGEDVKQVSRRLGHKNVSITYDMYSHTIAESTEQAAIEFVQMVDVQRTKVKVS